MTLPLHLLIVEDNEDDALLGINELRRNGFAPVWRRVETREAMIGALREEVFDAVLCDWHIPGFGGKGALEAFRTTSLDIPFILVSGTIDEETAVAAMRSGAHDLISKGRIWQLVPAIEREMREADSRKARRRAEEALREAQRIARIGSWVWSMDDDTFEASDKVRRIAGLEPGRENVTRSLLLERLALPSRAAFEEQLERLTAGSPAEAELEWLRPDGSRVFTHSRFEPDGSGNGHPSRAFGYLQDVTERKRAEMELVANREMLAAAQRIARLGTFSYNFRTGERRLTDEVFRIFGIERRAAGLDLAAYLSTVHPDDRENVRQAVSNAAAGRPYTIEYRIVRPDGTLRIVEDVAELVFDDAGEPLEVVGTTHDVTEKRLLERQILETERRYRRVVDAANDLIFTTALDGTVTSINPIVEKIGGWKPEEVVGRKFTEFMVAEDVPQAMDRLTAIMRGEEPPVALYRLPTRWGTPIVFESRPSAELHDGKITGFVVIGRDITERQRAEEAREALAREIETLLESTYEGIYATDAEGRCTMVNRAACAMLGWEAAELLRKKLHSVIHHHRADGSPYDAGDCPLVQVSTRTQQLRVADEVFWRRDGTSFPVEVLASPILDASGKLKGIVVSFTDQTEKKLLRAELDRAGRLSALGRVAATMSHEFNNVLMAIQPFAELILRNPTGDRAVHAARSITQSVDRGRRVTEEILRFTRPADPVRTPVDVADLLGECMPHLAELLPSHVVLDAGVPAAGMTMLADANQIVQVVTNLVINARDAIGAKAGRIVIRAEECPAGRNFPFGVLSGGRPFIHISIADDGPGVPRANLEHLFEPFFTTKKGGTGLGLAVAHQILTLHGGHIYVESVEKKGTTMHLFVPAADAAVAREPERVPPRIPIDARVLLVEDEEAIASGLQVLLESEGLSVRVAGTAREAMEILESFRPDTLVIDVGLPDIDGIELYERIVSAHGLIPTIFSSGHADGSRIRSSFENESVHFLLKPYALETLLAELETLLHHA